MDIVKSLIKIMIFYRLKQLRTIDNLEKNQTDRIFMAFPSSLSDILDCLLARLIHLLFYKYGCSFL